jgi:leader peptidase (prepilin peptidase)/N-methyltransferase
MQASPVAAASPSTTLPLPQRPLLLLAPIVAIGAIAFARLAVDRAAVAALVSAVLVVLSAIDIERGIIPNRIVLPATCVVLALQVALFPDQAAEWVLASLLVALLLMTPQLLGRAWLGMGDVKLGMLLGAGLGWGAFGALLLAYICVLPVSVFLLVRGGMAARSTRIPFGPFLSLGAIIVLLGPHLAGLPTG